MFYQLIFLVTISFNFRVSRTQHEMSRSPSPPSFGMNVRRINENKPSDNLFCNPAVIDHNLKDEENSAKQYEIQRQKYGKIYDFHEMNEARQKGKSEISEEKQMAEIDGDIILGGLINVHKQTDHTECSRTISLDSIMALECMVYTIDWINDQGFLRGIKLGAYIWDSCYTDVFDLFCPANFSKGNKSDTGCGISHNKGLPKIAPNRILGLIESASLEKSSQFANSSFKIPQIRFSSTDLGDANAHSFSTVPSVIDQVVAIVEIIRMLKWKSVSVIYEQSNSGEDVLTYLKNMLKRINVCIAVKAGINEIKVKKDFYYDGIVENLKEKDNVRGVVIFAADYEIAAVMKAVRRNSCTGMFSWIIGYRWNTEMLYDAKFYTNAGEMEGAIIIQLAVRPLTGFFNYFFNLIEERNLGSLGKRNPWFDEFLEQDSYCTWSIINSKNCELRYIRKCSGENNFSGKYRNKANELQFLSDSVLAFAYALKNMHKDLCGGTSGLCDKMRPIGREMFLDYLKNVSFKGLSGYEFRFNNNRYRPGQYDIFHFKQTSLGTYEWDRVGKYNDNLLELEMSKIRFRRDEPIMPSSVCSLPCDDGQTKFYSNENCCWNCFNCKQYQNEFDETACYDCLEGQLPNFNYTSCKNIQYMKLDSYWAIPVLMFSSVGIILTMLVVAVYIKHNDTPVVKASGRELCYILLGGIFLCYAVTFLLVQKPSNIMCRIQNVGIGLCFTIVYGAIFVKTNRIYRIFRCAARSTKGLSFTSPNSQIIICSGIISIQMLLSATWLIINPPVAITRHPTIDKKILVCSATHVVAFAYPMILIIICTIYAVLTRKIPEYFNESKFIGFTMYTTCIVWLAFIPLYITTSDEVGINAFAISVVVSLSATVTLFCFFTPKVYIIFAHPEKNVRQSLMKQRQHGNKNDQRRIPSKVDSTKVPESLNDANPDSQPEMTQSTCGTISTN